MIRGVGTGMLELSISGEEPSSDGFETSSFTAQAEFNNEPVDLKIEGKVQMAACKPRAGFESIFEATKQIR